MQTANIASSPKYGIVVTPTDTLKIMKSHPHSWSTDSEYPGLGA